MLFRPGLTGHATASRGDEDPHRSARSVPAFSAFRDVAQARSESGQIGLLGPQAGPRPASGDFLIITFLMSLRLPGGLAAQWADARRPDG